MSHVSHHPHPPGTRRRAAARGVTLIELMVVVAITAILAAVAVPQFTQFIGSRAIDAQVSALASSMRLARSEALKRNIPVTLCPSAAPEVANPTCAGGQEWSTGWLVFTDLGVSGQIDGNDTIIRVQSGFPGSGGMTANTPNFTLRYQANGLAVGNLGTRFDLKNKAAPTSTSSTRYVVVSPQGSSRFCKVLPCN